MRTNLFLMRANIGCRMHLTQNITHLIEVECLYFGPGRVVQEKLLGGRAAPPSPGLGRCVGFLGIRGGRWRCHLGTFGRGGNFFIHHGSEGNDADVREMGGVRFDWDSFCGGFSNWPQAASCHCSCSLLVLVRVRRSAVSGVSPARGVPFTKAAR